MIYAITESSQTRAVNIHGARDDLKKIQYKENDEIYKRKWQFIPSSSSSTKQNNNNKSVVKFSEIKTYTNEDILDDINLILCSLKKAGLKRAIIVDLTNVKAGTSLTVSDLLGNEVYRTTLNSTNNMGQTLNMDLSALPKGVYLFGVSNGKEFKAQKLVIQ